MFKKIILIFIFICSVNLLQAQEYSFGIKAGGNYSMGGELEAFTPNATSIGVFDGNSQFGFQAGVFFELKFGKFFVRPEVMFNTVESEFEFPGFSSTYSIEKLNIPVLFGYSLTESIDVFAGPAYNNIMNSTLEGTNNPNTTIVVQDTPLAGQIGVKWTFLRRFELDLRYEHMISSKQVTTYNMDSSLFTSPSGSLTRISFEDPRLNQIMLSLSFKIGDSENNTGRRRGGGCYF